MRKIDEIIVHCSATQESSDIGVYEITNWHKQRGYNGCGYHFVIRRDGTLETGRDIKKSGAHAKGHNSHSIGVCLVGGVDKYNKGEMNYTIEQWQTLEKLIMELKSTYQIEKVSGHRQYANKECPCFDVPAWVKERKL